MRRVSNAGRGWARRAPASLGGVVLWVLGAGGAGASTPADLVLDINTLGTAGTGFSGFADDAAVLVGERYVFVADDSVTGREPWVLDLATGATTRLADIHPGPTGSQPRDFVKIGTSLLFVATSPEAGEELWVTDGTAGGTEQVEDLRPGAEGSGIAELFAIPGDLAVFRADDGVAGAELWVSDGTAAGTFRLSDIAPGAADSFPSQFAWSGGELLFRANDGTSGTELWKYAGGAATQVADLEPGAGSSTPTALFSVGPVAFFYACRTSEGCELWRTNGTAAGTVLLADLHPTGSSYPRDFFWHSGLALVFFTADDGVHGRELWKLAGGVATRLSDLAPGTESSDPTAFGALATKLTFVADDGGAGSRLFSSDGAGVAQVKSLSTAGVPGLASNARSWNGRVYFLEGGSGCWRTDGTSAGTVRWATCLSAPDFAIGDGRLFYGRSDAGEREIWSIDATDALAQETEFASYSSNPSGFAWLGATAFFAAEDGVAGRELWVTDGTPAGTHLLDLEPGPDASYPSDFVRFGDEIWFAASTSATGGELFRSDGTATGTHVYPLAPGPDSSWPDELAVLGAHLFFVADDDMLGTQLFRTAGAGSPAEMLDFGGEFGLYPEQLTPSGSRLYFFGWTSATGNELFVVDEVAAEPAVIEILPGADEPSALDELVAWNGLAWFVADDGVHGRQVWRSNGTAVERVTDLATGYSPQQLTAGPGGVYFVYDEDATGSELWKTDGVTTTRVTDIAPLDDDAYPGELTAVGGGLYFRADDGATGSELWWTDGVVVAQVADLEPGAGSSSPSELVAAGDRLVFVADDGAGDELWIADGAGVRRLPEAWPGTGASAPTDVAVDPAATRIYFSGIGPGTWREPWRVDLRLFADGFESGGTGAWSATAP